MQKINIEGNNFQFHVIGQGKPLVFISGLGTDRTIWNNIVAELKSDFQIIYFDNKGVGENNAFTAPVTTLEMAADVAAIIRHLNLKDVCVIGHSLGSYVAQHIATSYPDLVEKLVLVSTRIKTSINTILHYNVVLNLSRAGVSREILIEDSLSWLYRSSYLQDTANTEKLIKARSAMPALSSFETFSNQVQCAIQHNAASIMQKITAQTLIVNGEEDIICTPKEANLLNEGITRSKLMILKDLGHMIPIENPIYLSEIIKDFCLLEGG
ncbi:MAG: alpha/beta hydrolase [Gammaproteobacteria bacterium]|nr:alpha/beta hydrolase [Gammaproteobacteria bacterium]